MMPRGLLQEAADLAQLLAERWPQVPYHQDELAWAREALAAAQPDPAEPGDDDQPPQD